MMTVYLVIQFMTGQNNFVGIHDNYVISGVHMRGIYGLMLPAKYSGYLRRKTAEHHSVCIHNIPLTFEGLAFGHIGLHGSSS